MITSGDISKLMQLVDWPQELKQIIDFTLLAWDTEMAPTSSHLEDKITDHLIGALQRLQREHQWTEAYSIDGQRNEYDPGTDTVKGRNDIIFQLGGVHSFTWECKVLHRGGKNLYTEYLEDGMMRFVIGKYSASCEHGGMIGYVLDGKLAKAQQGIESAILKHPTTLKHSGSKMNSCSFTKTDSRLKETTHSLPRSFTIVHVFLERS